MLVFLADQSFRRPKYQPLSGPAREAAAEIDGATRTHFEAFMVRLAQWGEAPADEKPILRAAMETDFGTNWYFYYRFGYSVPGKDLQPVDAITGATE